MKINCFMLFIILLAVTLMSCNDCNPAIISGFETKDNTINSDLTVDSTEKDNGNTVKNVAPDDSRTYSFDNYEELYDALCITDSSEHLTIIEDIKNYDYGDRFSEFVSYLADENSKLMIPFFGNKACSIKGSAEWQKITVFSNELLNAPWIWYYCDYNGTTVVVALTYTEVFNNLNPSEYTSFSRLSNAVNPDFPSPANYEKYTESYSSITEQNLSLDNDKTVSAVVYRSVSTERVSYRFVYDNTVVSVWAYNDPTVTDDEFWASFSLQEYKRDA